jgi:mono/diheme cytochrome c family protein
LTSFSSFFLAILLLPAVLAPIERSSAQSAARQKQAAPAPTTAAIEKLYRGKCAPCHLADGRGIVPEMSLADAAWKKGSSVKEIAAVIADGTPGTLMIGFKNQITAAEIQALARYVRRFDKTLKDEK